MMNEWFTQYIRTNPAAQQPPPPPIPQLVPITPQGVELLRLNKPPVDKIKKHGAEVFSANVDDDPERVQFWHENTIRVFDELSCTLAECLKCAISLLRDSAYQWWNTLVSVMSRDRPNASVEYQNRDLGNLHVNPKAQATSVSSVGSVKNNKPECQQCGRRHFGECWNKNTKACFKCGSLDHFIRDFPELSEKEKVQNVRLSNTTTRGRPPRNTGNTGGNRGATRDSFVRFEARAPARAYAIRAWEEASSPYVITTQKCMKKGYDAYLAYVLDTNVSESKIESVPIVCEFSDVFPEELQGLPPVREVKFGIELVSGTTPISIAPYRMAPTELNEFKAQLQELTDRDFARPSYSS
ncbi:Chaperone surA [Gossypium australe]|uniref:Chaperone surA n=1 Tax=Gossypium australe TaxID=47621 RepID=A0A5B6VLY2_9ROSI|nr:Chaperone surA [Gossypium australe]